MEIISPWEYLFKLYTIITKGDDNIKVEEFIKLTKDNPLMYINYCEIIIDKEGDIYLANPSHSEAMINYILKVKNYTRDDLSKEIPDCCLPNYWIIDKYQMIEIWYSGYIYSSTYGISDKQQDTLDKLRKEKLIVEDNIAYKAYSNEYKNYLIRKKMEEK